jgi:hypothetical protein
VKPSQYIQLALALIKLVNWITTRITKAEFEAAGYNKALAEAIAELQKNTGIAEKNFNEANKATNAELDGILKS